MRNSSWSLRKALFAKSFEERRRNQKQLYYRMPARPLVKALSLYFLKRGFLDGYVGFAYSVLMGFYEYLIVLKCREFSVENWNAKADRVVETSSGPQAVGVSSPKRPGPA
jgi:hypothetical protein